MQDIMVDLETLGTVPGCSFVSIGAVEFCTKTLELGEEFYIVVNRGSCKRLGLFEQQGTLDWWEKQSPAARKVLEEAEDGEDLPTALEEFNEFVRGKTNRRLWGNGADFDNAILSAAYLAANVKPALLPYNGRCYRTLKNLAPHIKLARGGTHHNALDDAKSQARHLMEIIRATSFNPA